MAIDLYVARSFREITLDSHFVSLEEHLVDELRVLAERGLFDDSLIRGLDPYADTVILGNDLRILSDLCDKLLCSERQSMASHDLINLLTRVRDLCEEAITQGSPILAVGD